ncbi:MAG: hypothetical protein EHM42_15625 [Planctomycetaceae bacterium]|nr:MAG: hypothetical protein EHM42_15625 [Planctomycetaceae bacterium]
MIFAVLFLSTFIGWLCAEAQGARFARLGCGLGCIAILLVSIFLSAQREGLKKALDRAAFRLLGETLAAADCEKARRAVETYNNSAASDNPRFRILDVLTGKE